MKDQKVSTALGTIILIIIATTVGGFVMLCFKNYPVKNDIAQTVDPLQLNHVSNDTVNEKKINDNDANEDLLVADNWKMVSHENFWNNPNLFSHSNYFFPQVVFYYPENWYFQCCNDMDHASVHNIFSSQNQKNSKPYIRITNYSLSGCPNTKKQCSLDEMIKLSVNEKFSQIISEIPRNYHLPKEYLSNMNTDVFVYQKLEKDNTFSKGYLIKLHDGVIGVDFVYSDLLGENFIEKFLSNISYENE